MLNIAYNIVHIYHSSRVTFFSFFYGCLHSQISDQIVVGQVALWAMEAPGFDMEECLKKINTFFGSVASTLILFLFCFVFKAVHHESDGGMGVQC